jgi:hypothetical protein
MTPEVKVCRHYEPSSKEAAILGWRIGYTLNVKSVTYCHFSATNKTDLRFPKVVSYI